MKTDHLTLICLILAGFSPVLHVFDYGFIGNISMALAIAGTSWLMIKAFKDD